MTRKLTWGLLAVLYVVCLGWCASVLIPAGKQFHYEWRAAHYEQIYYRLAKELGTVAPPFYIMNSGVINAYTSETAIYITTGLIRNAANDDEIALVLGHELAHYVLHHVTGPQDETPIMESRADQLGTFLMMKAGYDVCEGSKFFLRMREMYGDMIIGSHPSGIYRYYSIKMPWCKRDE